jgi:hypothetical protein
MTSPDFETLIVRQMEALKSKDYAVLEAESISRRQKWLEINAAAALQRHSGASPRAVFEILFFDYMKLIPEEVPVVHETPDEIIWRSVNACPTLEACLRLGLDTRLVCKTTAEKTAQYFVSRLDPGLKFGRSYVEIRPHSSACLEWICRSRMDHPQSLYINTSP